MLLDEIEKNPENTKNYMQLAQEYKGSRDFKKAEECCYKGIAVAEKASTLYTGDLWMMSYLPVFIFLQGDDQKALSEAEHFLEERDLIDLPKAFLYDIAVLCCVNLKEYKKGLKYVMQFHKTWKRLHQNAEEQQRYGHADMNLSEADKKVQEVYAYGLYMAVKESDFGMVSQIFRWIPWKDEHAMKPYYVRLEKWKNSFESEKEEILKCFSDISADTTYLSLQKALYAEQKQQRLHLKEFVERCQESYLPEQTAIGFQIVRLALKNELELDTFIQKVPFDYWSGYAQQIAKMVSYSEMDTELAKIQKVLKDYPLHYALFEQSFLEKKMMLGYMEGRELLALAEKYCKTVIEYYRSFYKESCFVEGNDTVLPAKCIFALSVREALDNRTKNEADQYVKNLRKALYACPEFSRIIGKLLKDFEKHKTQTSNIEFAQLGEQVKTQIKMLVSQGQYMEAYPILMKLIQMLPNDTELLKLKQHIIAGTPLPEHNSEN